MGTGTSILISVVAIAFVGVGAYYFFQGRQKRSAPLNIDKVDTLLMEDVVGWFKSLNLDSTKHTPFVCNNLNLLKLEIAQQITPPYVILGVYDENKKVLAPYRILELKNIDQSIKELLDESTNGLVVLS